MTLLLVTTLLILVQLGLALVAPARFIHLALWVQAIPLTWNFDVEQMFATPVGRLNVIAIQMFGLCLVSIVALLGRADRTVFYIAKYKWHALFILFCFVTLTYAPSVSFGLRMIAKLIGPLLFMLAVLVAIRTPVALTSMRSAILGSGVILVGMAVVARLMGIDSDPNVAVTGMSGLGPPGMGPPVFSAHMLPVAMLALAAYVTERKTWMLLLALLAALALAAALQRTSAAAMFLGFSVILMLGTRGVLRFLLPLVSVVALPLLLVFNDQFRRRMFFGATDSGHLLADPASVLQGINSSGRFSLWGDMLQRFFAEHPAFGSGIGATQEFLYGRSVAGAGVVHSEYVRLLCEVGITGLALFAAAVLAYVLILRKSAARARPLPERQYALAALGSLVAYLVYFATDNGFDYVLQFGAYVFALVGMARKAHEFARAQSRGTVPAASLVPQFAAGTGVRVRA